MTDQHGKELLSKVSIEIGCVEGKCRFLIYVAAICDLEDRIEKMHI